VGARLGEMVIELWSCRNVTWSGMFNTGDGIFAKARQLLSRSGRPKARLVADKSLRKQRPKLNDA
jgi:hypothetical protein